MSGFFRIPVVQTVIALVLAITSGFWAFRRTGHLMLWHASRHTPQPGETAVLAGCAGILAFAAVVAIVYPLVLAMQRAIERRLNRPGDERERLADIRDRDL
jgi:formate hydrogenlyase subunit 3/multisubunit Na+/H+ antiporter MnhD subunit